MQEFEFKRKNSKNIFFIAHRQKKTLSKDKVFFNEINPCGICEMHFVREIRLRRVKCLRA